ncbi:MAG TPA: hypothetical protein VFG68_19160, partial [Fimbriiglobus sp.]|nr:hypothetical protein [Fimbriiglobus sp.]
MAKAGVKDILLRKGEKIAIGIGVGLLGLLGLMGLMNVVGAESPDRTIDNFQKQAQRINGLVTAQGPEAEKLPPWVLKQLQPPKIDADQFAAASTIFEPIHQPDFLRDNPQVLPPQAFQVSMLLAAMPSLDIQENPDGSVLIGVLVNRPAGKKGNQEAIQELKDVLGRRKKEKKDQPKGRAGFGGIPGGGVPGGGVPGGGMRGGRGGMPGGGMPGGMPGPGGMGGGMPGFGGGSPDGGNPYGGSMFGMGDMFGGQRDDRSVEYVTPADVQKRGLQLAQTVYPLKAVLVQCALPVSLQIKENRKALRMPERKGVTNMFGGMPGGFPGGQPGALPGGQPGPTFPGTGGAGSPDGIGGAQPGGMPGPGGMFGGMPGMPGSSGGAAYMNSPYPVYDGFDVERRSLPPGAKDWSSWTPYDHENEYFTKIRARKWADDPYQGQGYLSYFLRPYTERLWAPLPMLADDLASWPE